MRCSKTVFKWFSETLSSKRSFRNKSNVSDKLRQNEIYKKYKPGCAISHLFANQVGAHSPIQETWAEAISLCSNDVMFGVFDGNSGSACSHVVAKRLFKYLEASLLPKDVLQDYINSMEKNEQRFDFLESFQDKYFFLEEYQEVYQSSFKTFIREMAGNQPLDVESALRTCFERLDADLSKEAMEDNTNAKLFLWVAMTGSGATVVHLSGLRATLATAGDSMVVVGTDDGHYKVLNPEHNIENEQEVTRVLEEHPGEEGLVRNGHLLGALTALRSFGNFRYKWDKSTIEKFLVPRYGENALPKLSISPPYLTATPEINHYIISPEDRFIVIASDGIWDIFPPSKVVEIIHNHRPVHRAIRLLMSPLRKWQQINSVLRKENTKDETEVTESPATQLILEGLVTTTKLLHLPDQYVRNVRDDMTVLILYIDQEYVCLQQECAKANLKEPSTDDRSELQGFLSVQI